METRLTLRPGQHGTRKLVERFGERLVRVRYLYDAAAGRRLKTVELIVESVPWAPRPRRPRRRDDEIVAVRIAFDEVDLRERARRFGAVWRPEQRLWEMHWDDVRPPRPRHARRRRLSPQSLRPICRHTYPLICMPVDAFLHVHMVASISGCS